MSARRKIHISINSGSRFDGRFSFTRFQFFGCATFLFLLPVIVAGIGTWALGNFGSPLQIAGISVPGGEFARVARYEKELKLRASMLETVLQDVQAFDRGLVGSDTFSTPVYEARSGSKQGVHYAIGEGDIPRAPIISVSQDYGKKLVKKNDSVQSSGGLLGLIDSQIERLRGLPLGFPVEGPVSSGFGSRVSPFTGKFQVHPGIDISIEKQTAVLATADGIVIGSGYKGGYGKAVTIKHGNGIETLYGHLSSIKVAAGERVCRGQRIGLVGATGHATGPHLHYEVRVQGTPKNPSYFVQLINFLKMIG